MLTLGIESSLWDPLMVIFLLFDLIDPPRGSQPVMVVVMLADASILDAYQAEFIPLSLCPRVAHLLFWSSTCLSPSRTLAPIDLPETISSFVCRCQTSAVSVARRRRKAFCLTQPSPRGAEPGTPRTVDGWTCTSVRSSHDGQMATCKLADWGAENNAVHGRRLVFWKGWLGWRALRSTSV